MTPPFRDLVEEAFRAHHASLFRFLDRTSGDPDLASDLAQEAFVRLYRRGALPERPEQWLVTVALNLFRNRRSQGRRREELRVERIAEIAPAGPPAPDLDAESGDERARVRRALDRLPERERSLLILRAEGYAYRDLAEVLGLHAASVGTLLARARRAFLAAYDEG